MKLFSLVADDDNKTAYLKKMTRQLKEAHKRMKELEKTAGERDAEANQSVHNELEGLRQSLALSDRLFESLKEETGLGWPEESREMSRAYKEFEELAHQVEQKIKPK